MKGITITKLDEDSQRMHPELSNVLVPTRTNLLDAYNQLRKQMAVRREAGDRVEFLLF